MLADEKEIIDLPLKEKVSKNANKVHKEQLTLWEQNVIGCFRTAL